MQKQRENIKKHGTVIAGAFVLLVVLFAAPSTQAQGPFVTPTPLPQVIATQQAASAQASAVSQQRAEAARMRARADEIDRNAQAQADAAARAFADAQSAAAAQNAAAFGEAIGQGNASLEQLKESVSGLKQLTISQAQTIDSQREQNISLTNALQNAQAARNTTQAAYEALRQNQEAYSEAHKNDSLIGGIASLFGYIVSAVLLVMLIGVVLSRKRPESKPPADDSIPTTYTVIDSDMDDEAKTS